jgi:dihydrofolate reductase
MTVLAPAIRRFEYLRPHSVEEAIRLKTEAGEHAHYWAGGTDIALECTGAMLVGRRTYEVGKRMAAENPSGAGYPFSGPVFVLTHEPPEPSEPEVTFLTGDIGEAVATALDAAGGKSLEILGADVATQCLQRGLVDEILVYVLPVLLGDGIRFSSPGLARIDLEPLDSTRSGAVTIRRFRVREQSSA